MRFTFLLALTALLLSATLSQAQWAVKSPACTKEGGCPTAQGPFAAVARPGFAMPNGPAFPLQAALQGCQTRCQPTQAPQAYRDLSSYLTDKDVPGTIILSVTVEGQQTVYATAPGQATHQTACQFPSVAPGVATTGGACSAQGLLERINAKRAFHGVQPLQVDPELQNFAEYHSGVQAMTSKLHHSRKPGLAENVAYGSYTGDEADRWYASPGHRANMLNPKFTRTGVATVQGANGYYSTQVLR